ncbi:MAG: nuclear transport factor 2 family protein [Thiobacillus sp.]
MDESLFKELAAVEEAFNQAVVSNDVARILSCISEDWTLVTPEVGPVSREGFLQAVEQGILSHDSMTKDIVRAGSMARSQSSQGAGATQACSGAHPSAPMNG